MPFTPAHAVVALPFARSRRWSAAAIASGAIAPDLPLFVSGGAGYRETHALWAVPTLDVVLGFACLALWWSLLRPGLLAVLPGAVRSRIGARRPAAAALLPVGVAIGALSHVVWDAFTHRGRFGSVLLPVLADRVGPFALTSWAQYASGAAGLIALVVAAVLAYRRTPPSPDGSASPFGRGAVPLGVAVLVAAVLVSTVAVAGLDTASRPPSGAVSTAAVVAVLTFAVLVAGVGIAARLVAGRPLRAWCRRG